jgi:AraC-like DNA-binding protein
MFNPSSALFDDPRGRVGSGLDQRSVSRAVFDTADYPEPDRERMFVHVYSLAVLVEILAHPVRCRIELCRLPYVHLRVASTSAQRSIRLPETIRMDGHDFVGVILLQRGAITGDLDGCRVEVGPGQALIADFGRPSSLEHSDHDLITIGLDRALVQQRLPWLQGLNGTVIDARAAEPLFRHLQGLLDRIRAGHAQHPDTETRAIADWVAATIPQPGDAAAPPRRRADDLRAFERAAAYIEAHLDSEDLEPSAIWKAANVSRSRLYRLFAQEGGVARYVIHQRLLRARQALANPDDPRTISAIAYDCGFTNVAHFARAFREAFGLTASQARNGSAPLPRRSDAAWPVVPT